MSDLSRHTRFFAARLADMDIPMTFEDGAQAALGKLPLGPNAFQTLDGPIRLRAARFYTLGHSRLKFYEPRPLFDLPAVDVSRCDTCEQVEAALRRAWNKSQADLAEAARWLERLGSERRTGAHGTRLRFVLPDEDGRPLIEVRSTRELLLSSFGPLRYTSLRDPGERRVRPLASLETAAEVELLMTSEAEERARLYASQSRGLRPSSNHVEAGKRERRALVVSHDRSLVTVLDTELTLHGVQVDEYADANLALAAFHQRSYELIVVEAQLPQADGLELAAQFKLLPGLESLPIVVVDDRESQVRRSAARDAGAAAYLPKPVDWAVASGTLVDLLDHSEDRRFERYAARLPVTTAAEDGEWSELTEHVSRGGLCIRCEREVHIGCAERYRITLPGDLGIAELVGDIVTSVHVPGRSSSLAGVRIRRFEADGEPRWIRLVTDLARRVGGGGPGGEGEQGSG